VRFVVVAPLREGMRESARLLVAEGPPFDLGATTLSDHEVYLTEREAVFVFTGSHAREELERAVGDPGVWKAAAAWRDCLDGRPRIAEEAFLWERGQSQRSRTEQGRS